LTGQHVHDLFFVGPSWPTVESKFWVIGTTSHYAFLLLVLFPASVRCIDLLRKLGLRGFLASTESLLLAPVLGLIFSAAIATGEPRYRIPFDTFFFLVAIQFFRSLVIREGARGRAASER
jgi:hypothetical protein